MGFCPWVFSRGGFCPLKIFPTGDFVHCGFFPWGFYLLRALSVGFLSVVFYQLGVLSMGFLSVEICPWGFCPWGFVQCDFFN